MPAEKRDRISNFPSDGSFWWIRWVDHYRVPHGRTGTPSVDVLLSPLPRHPFELEPGAVMAAYKHLANFKVVSVLAGSVPRLGLGRVFLDGMEVGDLPTSVETFTVNLVGDHQPQLLIAGDEMDGRPDGWDAKYRYRVVNSYKIGQFLNSKCWVARCDTRIVVLPCQEVFRAFLAPETEMALALTSVPWNDMGRVRLANPDGSGVTEDGAWHVIFRQRVHGTSAWHLANLLYSDAGTRAAAGIYASLLKRPGAAPIEALIPFDAPSITFTARCLKLHHSPDKYLVLEITHAEWPYPNQVIRTRRDNGAEDGDVVELTDDPPPYMKQPHSPTSGGAESTVVPVTPDEAPDAARPTESFRPHPLIWSNAPEPEEIRKGISYRYKRKTFVVASPTEGASAGNTTGEDTETAPAAYVSEPNIKLATRFQDVVDMLEHIQRSGDIQSWSVLPNPSSPCYRGTLQVWRLPLKVRDSNGVARTRPWSYLDRNDGIRRTALICKVHMANMRLYWVEIELRSNEGGRRSLICTTPDGSVTDTIDNLLTEAVMCKGIWRKPVEICKAASVQSVDTWKHSYITITGSTDLPKRSILNSNSALARMKQLLGIDGKPDRGTNKQAV